MLILKLKNMRAWIIKDQATGKNISAGIDLMQVINDAIRIHYEKTN